MALDTLASLALSALDSAEVVCPSLLPLGVVILVGIVQGVCLSLLFGHLELSAHFLLVQLFDEVLQRTVVILLDVVPPQVPRGLCVRRTVECCRLGDGFE